MRVSFNVMFGWIFSKSEMKVGTIWSSPSKIHRFRVTGGPLVACAETLGAGLPPLLGGVPALPVGRGADVVDPPHAETSSVPTIRSAAVCRPKTLIASLLFFREPYRA